VSLRKGMTNNHSINFFEFREFFGIWLEVICEFAYWNFFMIRTQKFGILIVLISNLVKHFAESFIFAELIFNKSHSKLVDIEPEGNLLKIGQEFDRSYLIYNVTEK
jgi:hypothetical protein